MSYSYYCRFRPTITYLLQYVRWVGVGGVGAWLAPYVTVFLDRQDEGPLILTPIYLLLGTALPLWLSYTGNYHSGPRTQVTTTLALIHR